ncbi:MAG: hypothetical protein LQ338_002073 [Usnochroma carphineum]|nr:MAG: hypothetical protein LQ338_002073 [Usnochroma carphineum]
MPSIPAIAIRWTSPGSTVARPTSTKSPALAGKLFGLIPRVGGIRDRRERISSPVSTLTGNPGPLSATEGSEIPLWGQCGLAPNEFCAEGARCICKNQWWSQCRVPINGSWISIGEIWNCTGPKPLESLSPSPAPRTVASSVASLSIKTSPTSLAISEGRVHSATNNGTPPSIQSVVQLPGHSLNTGGVAPSSSPSKIVVATPNAASPLTTTSSPLLNASLYLNPFTIPVSTRQSEPAPRTSESISHSETLSGSAEVTNRPPKPSSSTRLPNLACPSDPATEDTSSVSVSNFVAEQACNPGTSAASLSSTPTIPGLTGGDPDKAGTYLVTNASSDQQSHCLNFAAHQYQICWEVLNVTGYLQDWVAFNQRKCDDEDMGFADCFLYLEVGAGANCTSFTGRSQCPSPDSRTFTGHIHGAQAYYVAFNIWNIQNWFFTYYMAIGGANGLTIDNVDTIARTLNLPTPRTFPILDLLAGLAWAFGMISPSGYAAAIPRLGQKVEGFAAQTPGEYLLRAIQNSPTLSRNLVASGDLGNSDVQVAELSSDLARIVSQLENNVQSSIVQVMSNFSLFFDFVADGFFSTQIENLNTLTQNVTLTLNTYIVSQALQNDKVIITRALNTDVNELQLNGSAVQYDTGCGYGYDKWGMCGNWWYDSMNHISYGLESQKDMLNNYTDPLESLFNQGITTPELLFINSQICADTAGSTQGNAPGTSLTTTTGVWDTECISNMKICTWDTANLGVEHEYTDCQREGSFAMEECGDGEGIVQVTVPASYIGPYLTSVLYEGIACNSWGKGMGNPG